MPITKEQVEMVNELVREGEIDAARKLLTKWGAAGPLAKLNARFPETSKPAMQKPFEVKAPPKPVQSSNYKRTRNLMLFLLLCILVAGIAYLMIQWQRDYTAMNNLIEAMP